MLAQAYGWRHMESASQKAPWKHGPNYSMQLETNPMFLGDQDNVDDLLIFVQRLWESEILDPVFLHHDYQNQLDHLIIN